MSEGVHLSEFDKDEWRDVCRAVRPDWTEREFEEAWLEFIAMKQRRNLH